MARCKWVRGLVAGKESTLLVMSVIKRHFTISIKIPRRGARVLLASNFLNRSFPAGVYVGWTALGTLVRTRGLALGSRHERPGSIAEQVAIVLEGREARRVNASFANGPRTVRMKE